MAKINVRELDPQRYSCIQTEQQELKNTFRLNSESSAITIIIPVLFLQDIHLEQENLW